MLSFGYALLTQKVIAAAQTAGLDPYVGYLHAAQYGRPAVALDLMEEFRPIIADSVVLACVNRRSPRGGPLRHGAGQLFASTNRAAGPSWSNSRPGSTRRSSIRSSGIGSRTGATSELQARLLGKALLGETPAYRPFTVR